MDMHTKRSSFLPPSYSPSPYSPRHHPYYPHSSPQPYPPSSTSSHSPQLLKHPFTPPPQMNASAVYLQSPNPPPAPQLLDSSPANTLPKSDTEIEVEEEEDIVLHDSASSVSSVSSACFNFDMSNRVRK